jgi:hypothetical protein
MNYNFPIAFFDTPLLNMTATPIPGSASLPLQVIANIGFKSGIYIDYQDTSGDPIGVYLGPVGQEVLLCIIGNGQNGCSMGVFPALCRVSVRSLSTTPITNGTLTGTIMSY